VVLVGDIAGAPGGRPRLEPFEVLTGSGLGGVSFVEFFAMGIREAESLARLEAVLAGARAAPGSARLGLQPHAPNTVSPAGYRRAIELARRHGLPLATHLAETPEEREFIARGTGPHREMLERLGLWTDAILDHVGKGATPIEHLAATLAAAPFLLAHVNDTGPDPARAFETLATAGASVAYCPRASEYFHAATHFGPHRYREMLAAGVNVCLGTDSIVNLPRGVDGADGPGLSVLDEARLLLARDGADAGTLLRMVTVHGCRALGWDEASCSLGVGARPLGLVAVRVDGTPPTHTPTERLLRGAAPARLLALGIP
jgi:cytosine/adenosine deaminase-related metal-dependent hydrolase